MILYVIKHILCYPELTLPQFDALFDMHKCTCFCFLIVGWMWQVSGFGMGIIVTFRILHQFSIRSILPYITQSPIMKNEKSFSRVGCSLAIKGNFQIPLCVVLCSVVSSFWKWSLLWFLCCPFIKTNTVVACGLTWRLVIVNVLPIYCSVFRGLLLGLQWRVLS